MLIENALKIEEGIVKSNNKCYVCEREFNWYAVVNNEVHKLDSNCETGQILAENTNITFGGKVYADVSVMVHCKHCGILNKYHGIKIDLKSEKKFGSFGR